MADKSRLCGMTQEEVDSYMTEKNNTEADKAFAFSTSMRGQYIISQALCLTIDMLSAVEPEHLKEQSNIADMEYLRDNLYPMFHIVQQSFEPEDM